MSLVIWGIAGFIVFLIIILALCRAAAPSSPYERAREDEEQVRYLEEWRNKRKK